MRIKIGFEGKNGSRVHNWDPARFKIQEGNGKNVFEPLQPSRRDDKFINFQQT
jgi:hypothetical protein